MNEQIIPTSIAPPAANYAHAMVVRSPTRWLYTAGVVPTRPDGTVAEQLAEQADTVWANIAAILDEAHMSPTDIVSITTYVVAGEPLTEAMSARDRFLDGHVAASTLVTVPELAWPQWRIEIAIVAAAS
jgi:2-iminobutanoate/2-iminopropanoate deaminase